MDNPAPEQRTSLLGMIDKDFKRTVATGVVIGVLVAVIIGLPKFVFELASLINLELETLADIVPALEGLFFAVTGAVQAALDVIQQWQILLAAAFLGSVLFSAVTLNARHVLERDKQILDRRRRSLAGALQAEIQYLGNLCNLRAIQIADLIPEGEERFVMDERQRDEWKIGGMTIYNSNAADMGLLPAETTEKVVWIYTRLDNLNLVVSGGVITNKAKKGMEELAIGATAVITDLQEVVDSKFDT